MVHFVGAGPGAPDLITRRGAALLQTADCIIYAGSLVNPALLGLAKADCAIYNSAEMTLEQVLSVMEENETAHKTTVRLHTGDPPKLTYSDDFKAKQGETQVLADLAADTTTDTVFVPRILDVIPASVANTEFGKLLPSLADGTCTPEQFAQWMSDKAAEASAE